MRLFPALVLAVSMVPAVAAPIPKDVEMMIRRAVVLEDGAHYKAVLRLAREVAPNSAAEIAALALTLDKEAPAARARAQTDDNPTTIAAPVTAGVVTSVANKDDGLLSLKAWNTTFDLGGSMTTGTTDSQSVTAGLAMNRRFGRWDHRMDMRTDYARVNGATNRERLRVDYETNFRPDGDLYWFGFLRGERDRFSGLDYRFAQSAGAGYRLVDSKRMSLVFEAGPGLKEEQRVGADSLVTWTATFASRLAYAITPTVKLENKARAFAGGEGRTVENTAELTARVSDHLAARFGFELRYNSQATGTTEKTNSTTRATLLYSF